jgi:DNA invertase Pin-like site-specific DNA recombinase
VKIIGTVPAELLEGGSTPRAPHWDDRPANSVGALDARSTQDHRLIGKEGTGFKSLGDPWADTTSAHGRLMLTVLSGIAEFERSLILQRTNEGRARAMAEGIRFGRKPKLTKHQAREALKRVAAGEPLREIALSYAVDHSKISRLKARHAAEMI